MLFWFSVMVSIEWDVTISCVHVWLRVEFALLWFNYRKHEDDWSRRRREEPAVMDSGSFSMDKYRGSRMDAVFKPDESWGGKQEQFLDLRLPRTEMEITGGLEQDSGGFRRFCFLADSSKKDMWRIIIF